MVNIFISYSRRNSRKVHKIVEVLSKYNIDSWTDWKSIPKGQDWEKEIYKGIDEAEVFLFFISPSSISSKMCNQEFSYAVDKNKKILPVVLDTVPGTLRDDLRALEWTFCRTGRDNFDQAINEITLAIQTDYEWVNYHNKLYLKALEWKGKKNRLLQGNDLIEAEKVIKDTSKKRNPQITPEENQFVLESRKVENNRNRVRIVLSIGIPIIILFSAILGKIAYSQNQIAISRQLSSESSSIFEKNNNNGEATLSGLLAVEAAQRHPDDLNTELLQSYINNAAIPVSSKKYDGSIISIDSRPGRILGVVVNSTSGTVKVYDLQQDQEIFGFNLLTKDFNPESSFSPDGSKLLVTDCSKYEIDKWLGLMCDNEVAHIFDIAHWNEILFLDLPNAFFGYAFDPFSKQIAVGNGDLHIFNLQTGKESLTIPKGSFGGFLVYSHDGKMIATMGSEGSNNDLLIWNAITGRLISKISHDENVVSFAFNPKDDLIVTSSYDQTIKISESITGRTVNTIHLDHDIAYDVDFDPTGKWIISSNAESVVLWDVVTGKKISSNSDNSDFFAGTMIQNTFCDNDKLVSQGSGAAIVWNLFTGNETLRLYDDYGFDPIVCISDRNLILTASSDGFYRIWNISPNQTYPPINLGNSISSVDYSPNGKWVAASTTNGVTSVWDPLTGKQKWQKKVDGNIGVVAFSRDSEWVAQQACEGDYVMCGNSVIRVWEVNTGKELYTLHFEHSISSINILPGKENIAISGDLATIEIVNLESGKVQQKFEPDLTDAGLYGRSGLFTGAMDVDSSGLWLLGGNQTFLQMWNIKTGEEVAKIPYDTYSSVDFSRDGKFFIMAGDDIRIYNTSTKRVHKNIILPTSIRIINGITFSPDGHYAAGSYGSSLYFWDIKTREIISRLTFPASVDIFQFSPDGKRIIIGDGSGNVKISLWRPDDLVTEVCKRLTRNLTKAEWRQYFGNEPYRKTCPNLSNGS